ncbi:hypothetical protein GIB67_015597, partial [Kingdonia uniflora]
MALAWSFLPFFKLSTSGKSWTRWSDLSQTTQSGIATWLTDKVVGSCSLFPISKFSILLRIVLRVTD